jgi:hypothetical protein
MSMKRKMFTICESIVSMYDGVNMQ